MTFKVNIQSTLVFQSGSGTGKLTCANAAGRVVSQKPVSIAISGIGLGLGVFNYEGISGNLGWVNGDQVEGNYYVADANVAIGVGLGVSLDFYNQSNGLSFGGKIKAGNGFGVALNGSQWAVTVAP
jgi:hypothetical protein